MNGFQSLVLCFFFIVSSTFCTLYNKYIMTSVMQSSNLLLLAQALLSIFLLLFCQGLGLIQCETVTLSFSKLSSQPQIKNDLLIGILYALNVMTGLWSLKFLTVPIFGALKRSTILIVWLGELLFLHTYGIYECLPALLFMILGTLIAMVYDIHFVAAGYILATLSSLFQGASFVLSKKMVQQHKDQTPSQRIFGALYFNSLVSVPLLVVIVSQSGEWQHLENVMPPNWINIGHLILNGLTIMTMNYSVFLNCNLNSPLSHATCGNLKAAATSLIGHILFHRPVSQLGGIGILMNFLGGVWYTGVKYQQGQRKKVTEKEHEHV